MSRFAAELKFVGYSEWFRKQVIDAAIWKYKSMLSDHMAGIKHMYRDKAIREAEQKEKGGKRQKELCIRVKWVHIHFCYTTHKWIMFDENDCQNNKTISFTNIYPDETSSSPWYDCKKSPTVFRPL